MLRVRRNSEDFGMNDLDSIKQKNSDLEVLNINLNNQLESFKRREQVFLYELKKHGINSIEDIDFDVDVLAINAKSSLEIDGSSLSNVADAIYLDDESKISFFSQLFDRLIWLVGLLIFQSGSSFILSSYYPLLNKHPAIVFFLTMLVGSGGNAGNQASVRAIRGIALGTLNQQNYFKFLSKEFFTAWLISGGMGIIGLLRSMVSFDITPAESISITISLIVIVFVSIILGALLPIGLHYIHIDPAHASTSIQVIMDISGVLITCLISTLLLDSMLGKYWLFQLGLVY